jgi:hypothetical protein
MTNLPRGSTDAQDRLDTLADALRRKDAEQRGTHIDLLAWQWLTPTDKTKWRELAIVAITETSKPPERAA